MELWNIFTDTRSMQWTAAIASCVLAFVLLLIRFPLTDYTKKLNLSKNAIAISFLLCGFLLILSLSQYDKVFEYEKFSSMIMLVAVSISSLAVSFAMIILLDEDSISSHVFINGAFILLIVSTILIAFALGQNEQYTKIAFYGNIVYFILQSVSYIVKFDKVYKASLRAQTKFYGEEEGKKIKWVRFCYIIAMLTNIVLLVYILLPEQFIRLYMGWYILYSLYMTANFISFLSASKIPLDAFAHEVLSMSRFAPKPKKKEFQPVLDLKAREKEYKTIATSLDKWVEAKKYRETDKSREEIADQLGTSREMMKLYFTTVLQKDFRTWRTELRIEDAKQLLLEDPQASPGLVAEKCGFSDRSNFHKNFVKLVGCSPIEWREMNRK